eukprot:TRINITY_DN11293_c0_g1_i1.p1 TRINITY_DN11293_c0_g1~~TRINITY_DN11293_c0_g1_i1.p1  ORF type:complete len:215 (+),score=11.42 TRINITY_DN11293_c0_g1_i1:528-1172(+)
MTKCRWFYNRQTQRLELKVVCSSTIGITNCFPSLPSPYDKRYFPTKQIGVAALQQAYGDYGSILKLTSVLPKRPTYDEIPYECLCVICKLQFTPDDGGIQTLNSHMAHSHPDKQDKDHWMWDLAMYYYQKRLKLDGPARWPDWYEFTKGSRGDKTYRKELYYEKQRRWWVKRSKKLKAKKALTKPIKKASNLQKQTVRPLSTCAYAHGKFHKYS